jgi:hypothetical protein
LNSNSLILNFIRIELRNFRKHGKRSTSGLAVFSAGLLQQFIHYLFDSPLLMKVNCRSHSAQTHHSTQLFRGSCLITSAFKNVSWESKPERNSEYVSSSFF